MKEFFKKIFSWLISKEKVYSANEFEAPKLLKVKEIEKEFDLVVQARRLGEKNNPRTNETSLSGDEAKLVNHIEQYRTKCANWRDLRINIQNRNFTGLNLEVDSMVNAARQVPAEFKQEINVLLDENRATLLALKNKLEVAEKEFVAFKQRHNLTRNAKYPSSGKTDPIPNSV